MHQFKGLAPPDQARRSSAETSVVGDIREHSTYHPPLLEVFIESQPRIPRPTVRLMRQNILFTRRRRLPQSRGPRDRPWLHAISYLQHRSGFESG